MRRQVIRFIESTKKQAVKLALVFAMKRAGK